MTFSYRFNNVYIWELLLQSTVWSRNITCMCFCNSIPMRLKVFADKLTNWLLRWHIFKPEIWIELFYISDEYNCCFFFVAFFFCWSLEARSTWYNKFLCIFGMRTPFRYFNSVKIFLNKLFKYLKLKAFNN